MDAKAIANAAYVLQRAEAKLITVTENAEKATAEAIEKAKASATEKQAAKLKDAQQKVVDAKATLAKLTAAA